MKLEFVCPLCKGDLSFHDESYTCAACDRTFPVIYGIPDFRVYPDPYIDLEADRAKGLRLAEAAKTRDFAGVAATTASPIRNTAKGLDWTARSSS